MSAHSDEEKTDNNYEKNQAKVTLAGITDTGDGVVRRDLKSRHISMIALGGTIGTGLFVGSGAAYSNGGPLGIVLGYSIMGTIVYSMMIALGEMTTLLPVSGAFTHYASRFVDPALGFALGWNYWYSYAITLPTEITAAALVINYWPGGQNVNVGVWISIFLVTIISFNFMGVRYYGEAEFWFSMIKIITILGLILLGIIISAGGVPGSDPIGFQYWKVPFQQFNGIPGTTGQFLAFFSTLVQAAFSYLGTEIVALTAGEAENPRRNVPRAIKRVFYRILLFYVAGVFVISIIVSPNNDQLLNGSGTAASPWVIGIETAGIAVLPSIVNSVVLISAFSAGNSDLYASSRTLYGLACDGKAPAFFRRCTKNGLPIYALIATAVVGLLAFLNVSTNGSVVFNWFVNLSAITGLITWWCILLTYIRFYNACKVQGINRADFPYRAPFQPYASYFGFIFISIIIFFNGFSVFLAGNWDPSNFVISYITIVFFIILYVFWKLFRRTKLVPLHAADFETGRRELDELSAEEELKYVKPTTFAGKLWKAVM